VSDEFSNLQNVSMYNSSISEGPAPMSGAMPAELPSADAAASTSPSPHGRQDSDWKQLSRLGGASWLSELWHYRELCFFFVWRDLKVKYKQSLLGIMWAILQPLLTMLIFTLFFGRLARMPSDGAPYPVFYYSALLPWTLFAAALMSSGNSLVSNTNLISKVYFPRIALPISSVLSCVVDFGAALPLLFGMLWLYGVPLTFELLLLPVLVLPALVLALGTGMFLAALNVRYRDVKYVLPFMIQAWLFISPVIYPASLVPYPYREFLFLNPMSGIISAFRASVLPQKPIDWEHLGLSMIITLAIFLVGAWYFRHTEREFADII
jgi:lipopolysaccharide transport system permease protein